MILSDDDFEIKSKIYSFNLRLVLKHILHSQDVFFRNLLFTILYYIKKKNSVRTRMERSCRPSEHFKNRFQELRRTIRRMLRERRLNYINSICASRDHNPKRFWSYFKIVSKSSNTTSKVSLKSGINKSQRMCFNNNVDIANCFNEYFASIFTHDNNDDHNLKEHLIVDPDIVLENITLTNDEVITVLPNLNNNKAHGPDGIPARLLTETSSQITSSSSTNRYIVVFFLMTGN